MLEKYKLRWKKYLKALCKKKGSKRCRNRLTQISNGCVVYYSAYKPGIHEEEARDSERSFFTTTTQIDFQLHLAVGGFVRFDALWFSLQWYLKIDVFKCCPQNSKLNRKLIKFGYICLDVQRKASLENWELFLRYGYMI